MSVWGFNECNEGILTGKTLETGVEISDGSGVDIADIGHQVGNLDGIRNGDLSLLGE